MTLSTKLEARLASARSQRQAKEQPRQKPANPFLLSGAALGLSVGIAAFTFGAQHPTNTLPPVPVAPAPVLATEAAPPAVDINDVKPGTRCNPYVNGVYIGELCGDHDAFQGRLDRAFAPEGQSKD